MPKGVLMHVTPILGTSHNNVKGCCSAWDTGIRYFLSPILQSSCHADIGLFMLHRYWVRKFYTDIGFLMLTNIGFLVLHQYRVPLVASILGFSCYTDIGFLMLHRY